jgi:hypothetical protein
MLKYFHQLRPEEYLWLVKEGTTWGELQQSFPQPPWCTYPQAVYGLMGCWSLVGFMVTGKEYCLKCDCYKEVA